MFRIPTPSEQTDPRPNPPVDERRQTVRKLRRVLHLQKRELREGAVVVQNVPDLHGLHPAVHQLGHGVQDLHHRQVHQLHQAGGAADNHQRHPAAAHLGHARPAHRQTAAELGQQRVLQLHHQTAERAVARLPLPRAHEVHQKHATAVQR